RVLDILFEKPDGDLNFVVASAERIWPFSKPPFLMKARDSLCYPRRGANSLLLTLWSRRARFRKKCRSGSTGPQKWPSVTGQTLEYSILTRTKHVCSCALICICHDVDPCIPIFVFSRGRLGRARAIAPAHVGSLQL